ncbi:hypothetical protein L6164_031346 [Bauhinia variegata]|uniref:Uncharacterized protein n=1 Tax=Bauhinia variegata TaxID=167791 RepID=A0ACB9LFX2_BAUVA|nr:hypothetical protein L6164_031346 [Bauhinia variegata]
MEAESVVVILDAASEVDTTVFIWALNKLPLKPRDKLTLLLVLNQITNPMGYKMFVNQTSMLGANKSIIEEEAAMRMEMYQNHEEIVKIVEMYESKEVEFSIQLIIGPKEDTLETVKELKSTWVIIDRKMKKDGEFFLKNLSCDISRLKRDKKIEHLRVPPESIPQEYNSRETYNDSTHGCGESLDTLPESPMAKKYSSPRKEENDPTLAINDNDSTSQIVSDDFDQLSQHQQDTKDSSPTHEINNNQMIGENIMMESSKCSVCKNRRPNLGWQKEFSYKELKAATDGFSIENSLSEGGYGPTFEGHLEAEVKIVVKQHQIADPQVEKNILKARHKNVAMLLGLCREESHNLIVYEYACNGSLDKYLSNESCMSLTWRQRVKIALGCCRGLKFLHENAIIHGSIKSSNILLTHDFEPLLGNISFGKEKHESKKSFGHKNSGYLAPEFLENGKLTTKTDVYSMGVVLLELISGRRATDKAPGDKILVVWAKQYFGGKKFPPLVDPKISNSYIEEELLSLVRVTEQCLKKNPKNRLSMNMVVSELQGISDNEEYCVIEESLPESSSTSSFADMSGSKVNEKTLETESLGENMKQTDCQSEASGQIINNDQITDQTDADQPSQVEHQMPSRSHADEGTSGPMVRNNHTFSFSITITQMTGEIQEDVLYKYQIRMESIFHQDLQDRYQSEIVENSKCAVCSICKVRRPNIGSEKNFTYEELQAATDGFSNENSLSDGGYGPVFKGQLDGKLKIVVKQHQISDPQVEKNIKSRVQSLLTARHKNVVMLLGCSRIESQQLIVYETICNGSLAMYLSKESCKALTWSQRVKVAVGCCQGLKFLHENNIIHGSIKPSNILLTHDFEPLLGNFSFAKAGDTLKKTYKDKNSGYMAPELCKSGKFSNKTDVYSFGVVLLELITGKRVTGKQSGRKSLVEWAKPLLGGNKYTQLIDPKIINSYEDGQLLLLVKVTAECLKKNPKKRSSMNVVVSELQVIADGKECYVIEDTPPANPYSTCSVQGINGSQDQTKIDQLRRDEEPTQSREHEEEWIQQPVISTNHMIDQTTAAQLSEDEEQMQRRPLGEERSLRETVSNVSDITSSQGDEESHNVSDVSRSQGDELSLYVSEETSSQADDDSLAQEDLSTKVSQEKEKFISCGRSNKETENRQESKNSAICDAGATRIQEDSLSSSMSQKSERLPAFNGHDHYKEVPTETNVCRDINNMTVHEPPQMRRSNHC